MIYLASPYSHPDPAVRAYRYEAACRAVGKLLQAGVHAWSPIASTHPVALVADIDKPWAYWEAYDLWFLERMDAVCVLMLPGWEKSVGVVAEIARARELGKPVSYLGENDAVD